MQEIVFGIGPNPIKDENPILLYCPLVLYVSDKTTWEVDRCYSDLLSEGVYIILGRLGFGEEDGYFEPGLPLLREEILSVLEFVNFTYNQEFEEFMKVKFISKVEG